MSCARFLCTSLLPTMVGCGGGLCVHSSCTALPVYDVCVDSTYRTEKIILAVVYATISRIAVASRAIPGPNAMSAVCVPCSSASPPQAGPADSLGSILPTTSTPQPSGQQYVCGHTMDRKEPTQRGYREVKGTRNCTMRVWRRRNSI